MKNIESSYLKNNYGPLFESLVKIYKPEICLELGCLNGYSGIFTALGLKSNKKGKLHIIDLFENYSYNHCAFTSVKKNFSEAGVLKYVEFIQGDVFEKCEELKIEKIDFLHIDISNNGVVLKKLFKILIKKFTDKTIIIFEGGSTERDNIEWMKKYRKTPINKFIKGKWFQNNFEYFVFEPYPSVTLCKKKFF